MEKISCIYMIRHRTNKKVYIGKTVDFNRRLNEYNHRKASKGKKSKYLIMQAIEKDGFEKFIMKPICLCSKDELDVKEAFYINKYKSYLPEYGYNSMHRNKYGKNVLNKETKEKMRLSHIGLKESSSTKQKKSNKIITIDEITSRITIYDSAKLFGDQMKVSKDMVKNCLRQPSRLKGIRVYYFDKIKRKEIVDKMKSKRCIRDKNYIKFAKLIDNWNVETIEKNYTVTCVSYDDYGVE